MLKELKTRNQIIAANQQVFSGDLGLYPVEEHQEIDHTIPAVQVQLQYTLIAVQDEREAELLKLEKLGVITCVHEPSDWISGMVTMEKRHQAHYVYVLIHVR